MCILLYYWANKMMMMKKRGQKQRSVVSVRLSAMFSTLTRYRLEGGETIFPPPIAVLSKNRGGSMSVRGRVRSSHISGGRRWLSCRQPASVPIA